MKQVHQIWPDEFIKRYREEGYWTGQTFPSMLRECACKYPDSVAVVDATKSLTYMDLEQRAKEHAAGFLKLGIKPGERVLVQMGNVVDFFPVIFGLFQAGIIPVYSLPAHRLSEIRHLAEKSEAVAMVTVDEYGGFDYRELAKNVQAQVPAIRNVIIAGDAGEFIALEDCVAPVDNTLPDPDPCSVAFLQISGGSTGMPKLIPRTHDDYIYSFSASNEICGVTHKSVYLVALPVAHNFPMSSPGYMGTLFAGGKVVMAPSGNPESCFPLIEKEKVTITGLVPPLARLWLDAAEFKKVVADITSLETLLVGGAKFDEPTARRVKPILGCQLQQVFGMAEGLVNYTRFDDDETIIATTQGRPISPADEVLVVDDNDRPVADGITGHLLTRGPYTIRAYHNAEEANQKSFTKDGFYRTGDIVRRLASGHLEVLGRAGDHINRAGEKISAEEVESHLIANPEVYDATVVSIPDEGMGEKSCAFVIPISEAPKKAALKRWMREREVADFKIPDQIIFVEKFNTTAVGKISRKELREQMRQWHLEEEEKIA
ncbi:(2,3-dihydroxybenzoyl)adenylate synthase [Curvivirga sp.]|uniref:(2,3-dihydroxybenzoyl)adenylate synthase n=1 Tax=Curvivirga sp. TaxID=2856848 RepID=UPI003B5C3F71